MRHGSGSVTVSVAGFLKVLDNHINTRLSCKRILAALQSLNGLPVGPVWSVFLPGILDPSLNEVYT